MPRRYWAAIAVAVLIVGAGIAFCIRTRRAIRVALREALAAEARTPENSEVLNAALKKFDAGENLEDVGLEVPASLLQRIALADLLLAFRGVWIAITLGICLGIAWLIGPAAATHADRADVSPSPPAATGGPNS